MTATDTPMVRYTRTIFPSYAKKEYLLPNIVAELLKENRINVKVLETHDKWFGVTYAEDKEYVQNAFKQLIEDGVYPEKLWR